MVQNDIKDSLRRKGVHGQVKIDEWIVFEQKESKKNDLKQKMTCW